jgi:hypothetical protein
MEHIVRELPCAGLASLAWAGDELVDWIGGRRLTLAGDERRFNCGYSYRFDAATGLRDVAAIVETLGTKGRLVRLLDEPEAGSIGFDELRELDRSYYESTAYAYPACILDLPDGRMAIAHCPRRYDTLELELLDGTPLTRRTRDAEDVFHSRLAASPDGRWLLSNGWVWQPWNVACVYEVARSLAEPEHLSTIGIRLDLGAFEAEVDAAALSGDRLIVSASAERPMLSVIELPSGKNLHCIPLSKYLGTQIMAWGPDHIVAFEDHPRVIALTDGEVVAEWPELATSPWQQPSHALEPPRGPPCLAIDPLQARFAIADANKVTVIARAG